MRRFNIASARKMLRSAIERMQPAAVEYIDWQHFDSEMEKAMAVTDVSKAKVTAVFAQSVTRARQRYLNAVRQGGAWRR